MLKFAGSTGLDVRSWLSTLVYTRLQQVTNYLSFGLSNCTLLVQSVIFIYFSAQWNLLLTWLLCYGGLDLEIDMIFYDCMISYTALWSFSLFKHFETQTK